MNIFRKLFDKFKKKDEVKKEEVWFNQHAQKGEVLVNPCPDESSMPVEGMDAALTKSLTNSNC